LIGPDENSELLQNAFFRQHIKKRPNLVWKCPCLEDYSNQPIIFYDKKFIAAQLGIFVGGELEGCVDICIMILALPYQLIFLLFEIIS